MAELIQSFSLSNVNRSGAAVDEKRLAWMNKEYFTQLCQDEVKLEEVAGLLKESVLDDKENFKLIMIQ